MYIVFLNTRSEQTNIFSIALKSSEVASIHSIKAYSRSEGIAALILHLNTV